MLVDHFLFADHLFALRGNKKAARGWTGIHAISRFFSLFSLLYLEFRIVSRQEIFQVNMNRQDD